MKIDYILRKSRGQEEGNTEGVRKPQVGAKGGVSKGSI
jgi:hypothetical protein